MNAKQAETYLPKETIKALSQFSSGRIKYSIASTMNISDFPTYPNGFSYTMKSYAECVYGSKGFNHEKCEVRKKTFDYVDWAEKYKVCEKSKEVNADEIWIIGLPYIMNYINTIIGPTESFNEIGGNYIVPECTRHYLLVNYTYSDLSHNLFDYSYRASSIMDYISSVWDKNVTKQKWLNLKNKGGDWLKKIPSKPGETEIKGSDGQILKLRNDWWYYILYPQHSMLFVEKASGVKQ